MKIDDKLVQRIASLGRVSLSDDENKAMVSDLSKILAYIEKLNELDIKDVEPTSHVLELANVTREDVSRPSISADQALANAPDRADNFYRVPKIIEQ
jgi:aspartyl-tRNA(Asn)/glutamyl-tRNA(Gln) amidotransferase subunit C